MFFQSKFVFSMLDAIVVTYSNHLNKYILPSMEDVKLHSWVYKLSLMQGTYHKPPKSKAKAKRKLLQHAGTRTSCVTGGGGQAKAKTKPMPPRQKGKPTKLKSERKSFSVCFSRVVWPWLVGLLALAHSLHLPSSTHGGDTQKVLFTASSTCLGPAAQ
jgi:hypothetical protein